MYIYDISSLRVKEQVGKVWIGIMWQRIGAVMVCRQHRVISGSIKEGVFPD